MPKSLPIANVEDVIHVIRGLRVMLDADLAGFYGVETKVLNQAVRRNIHRFPKDFAFRLDSQELTNLRSQSVTSSSTPAHGGRRYLPWVFTEHGAVMLASVLNSAAAISASVEIVRAFVKMRQALQISGGDLAAKLADIDLRLGGHDETLRQVIAASESLLSQPAKPAKEVGFHTLREDEGSVHPRPRRPVRYPAKRPARNGTGKKKRP